MVSPTGFIHGRREPLTRPERRTWASNEIWSSKIGALASRINSSTCPLLSEPNYAGQIGWFESFALPRVAITLMFRVSSLVLGLLRKRLPAVTSLQQALAGRTLVRSMNFGRRQQLMDGDGANEIFIWFIPGHYGCLTRIDSQSNTYIVRFIIDVCIKWAVEP